MNVFLFSHKENECLQRPISRTSGAWPQAQSNGVANLNYNTPYTNVTLFSTAKNRFSIRKYKSINGLIYPASVMRANKEYLHGKHMLTLLRDLFDSDYVPRKINYFPSYSHLCKNRYTKMNEVTSYLPDRQSRRRHSRFYSLYIAMASSGHAWPNRPSSPCMMGELARDKMA